MKLACFVSVFTQRLASFWCQADGKNLVVLGFMNKAVYNIFQLLKNLVKLDVIIHWLITVVATLQNHVMLTHWLDPIDWGSMVISLVLVYAGIPTIFANFRTFIRLYLIIFHRYIAVLRRNPMSHLYIALLGHATSHSTSQCYIAPLHRTPIAMSPLYVTSLPHNPMSQLYVALLCRTYVTSLLPRCITSHRHCLVSLHVTSQVIGPSQAERSTTP